MRRLDALSKKAGSQTSAMIGNYGADQGSIDPTRERPSLPRFTFPFRLRNE
jgi:hypothetical protein